MNYSYNAGAVLCKVSNAVENQLLPLNNMEENASNLCSRSVFGVLTNNLNNAQRITNFNRSDCLNKHHDHPNRRRRKLSSEASHNISPSSSNSSENGCVIKLKHRKQEKNNTKLQLSLFDPKLSLISNTLETKLIASDKLLPLTTFEDKPAKPQSLIAFDVVRAAFTKHIGLEDFLNECQFADFSFSAMAKSPVARMMEATDYVIGIMAYEQSRETKAWFQLNDFIARESQPSITYDMITTLADWMVEVQENFAFNHETIHLAWGLLYSYLDQSTRVQRREIQLMACAAIMIACKHEERQMPRMSEFLYITDNAYTKEEFLEAECRLLVTIDFNVHRPNPYVFLRRYARVIDTHSGMVQFMSRFLLEVGMHSHTISLTRESKKAAAVLWLARRVLSNPSYKEWLKRPETQIMRYKIRQNSRLRAIFIREDIPHKNENRSVLTRSQSAKESITSLCSNVANQSRPLNLTRLPLLEIRTNKTDEKPEVTTYESEEEIDQILIDKVHRLRDTDDQLCPIWPSILQHITGYEEDELIPLALSYHKIAMRLLAEVVRGGELELASSAASSPVDLSGNTAVQLHPDLDPEQNLSCGSDTRGFQQKPSSSVVDKERSMPPENQHLRRQVVTKYWSPSFLSVADAYPQLSFENLIPYFPEIQCKDDCACFVCENLINKGPHDRPS